MHSFHQSRGRIFFEVLCVLAISASCVGTWMQTGAPAPLAAAAVTLLYGLVHLFDMRRPRSVVAKAEAVEHTADEPVAVAQPVTVVSIPEVAEITEPAVPAVRKPRQPKAPRKKAKVVEILVAEETEVAQPVLEEEPVIVELMHDEEPAPEEATPFEEEHHGSVTPLFEPVPFVRQQRTGFGRKSGLAFPR